MKVLITGGTGFLGSNLALHYARGGHQVVAIAKEATDAERENARDLRAAGVEVVLGSVTDHVLLAKHCQGTDLVHHIAAAMREANIPDQVFWQVNVESTRAFLDAARAANVGRFVYCSSIGVMGKSPRKPANEQSPGKPEDIYQVTKKAAEELCLEYQRTHNYPIAIVRPADVYGPRDRRLLKLFKAIQKGRFVLFGSGKNEHHMVHIDDMVQGFTLAAESPAAIGEVFIIAGEQAVTIERLTQVIAQELGVPAPKIKVPLLPVQVLAVVVEAICKPIKVQPPIYPRRVDFFRTDFAFDIAKAKRVLGYRPHYSIEAGVRSTLAWYQERGLVARRSNSAFAKGRA